MHEFGRSFWVRPAGVGLVGAAVALGGLLVGFGCSPKSYRTDADETAYSLIQEKQGEALDEAEPFTIARPEMTLRRRLLRKQGLPVSGKASLGADQLEPIEHWPEEGYPRRLNMGGGPVPPFRPSASLRLSMVDALQVGARNSRSYQSQKENVYRAALDLDLEKDAFRNTYFGLMDGVLSTDQSSGSTTGFEGGAEARLERQFKSGADLSTRLAVDLAQLISSDRGNAVGSVFDASISIPLLRGAGRHIVTEPLTQAERDLVYAIWDFERFKREFAVNIVQTYYDVLQAQDQVQNSEESYRNQVRATRRQQADASLGRVAQEELDQALQQELQVRNSWIRAKESYQNALDRLKLVLGLPTDAEIAVARSELQRLEGDVGQRLAADLPELSEAELEDIAGVDAAVELEQPSREGGGPYELEEGRAVRVALENRLDLRIRQGRAFDSQRQVVVAADALEADVTLTGNAGFGESRSLGSVGLGTGSLRPEEGFYSAGLMLDLPWERTSERNVYRDSYIRLQEATRNVEELEDQVKQSIRSRLRALLQARESYTIQLLAERVAERRVDRTEMLQDLGRAGGTARDVNEAQADLLDARNAVTSALINYRVSELELQRDMGVLKVNEKGLYREYEPEQNG